MGKHNIWMSVSDLMTGLMVIFLFIAIAYMKQVNEYLEKLNTEMSKPLRRSDIAMISELFVLDGCFVEEREKMPPLQEKPFGLPFPPDSAQPVIPPVHALRLCAIMRSMRDKCGAQSDCDNCICPASERFPPPV